MASEFSVRQFMVDGTQVPECEFVEAEVAMKAFVKMTTNVSAKVGITRRVIITDGGGHTNVEWIYGEGITYPPELKGKTLAVKV